MNSPRYVHLRLHSEYSVTDGIVRVGDAVHAVREGHAVFCPAGSPHGVENAGPDDLRLLVFMAPHPKPPT